MTERITMVSRIAPAVQMKKLLRVCSLCPRFHR